MTRRCHLGARSRRQAGRHRGAVVRLFPLPGLPVRDDGPEQIMQLVATGDITLPDLKICWCCAGIEGREERPAVVWWLTKRGYWLGLCLACCTIWRHEAQDAPDLGPARLTGQRPRHAALWLPSAAPALPGLSRSRVTQGIVSGRMSTCRSWA